MSSLHRSSAAALAVLLAISVLLSSPPCATAIEYEKPIVVRVAKDDATSLYTIAIKDGGAPLLLDLGGPLLWATCPTRHRTFRCGYPWCEEVNRSHPPVCGPYDACSKGATCKAYPYNPVNGRCGHDDTTVFKLAANTTNGKNPLSPVLFNAIGSCAPGDLLASLPAGMAGVAGLSRLPVSLPTLLGDILKVPKQFALCLPSWGSDGVAIFGGGPFQLMASTPVELAERLRQNMLPLLRHPSVNNGAYYFRVTGITVNEQVVPTPPGTLDLDPHTGTGGALFSTATPYTVLRPDIYRALHDAFDEVTRGVPRVTPVAPFDMCYLRAALPSTRMGYGVPNIGLILDDGRTWTMFGGESLVWVNSLTVCFAFVEMAPSMPAAADSPAVILGGFQMSDHLLIFDLEKETFAFSGALRGIRTSCSNFNFSVGSSHKSALVSVVEKGEMFD